MTAALAGARRIPFTLTVVAAMLVLGIATTTLWSPRPRRGPLPRAGVAIGRDYLPDAGPADLLAMARAGR